MKSRLAHGKPIHPDLHVVHSIPGRIRLRARKIKGQPKDASEVVRRLGAVRGVHKVDANAKIGSLTVHYDPSAPEAVEFFAEIAAALGLIAVGLDPTAVQALFKMFGVSPAEVSEWLGDRIEKVIVISIGIFVLGYLAGQRFG